MKILIKNGLGMPLPVGIHMVYISKIQSGVTSHGIEYFDCYFENNEGQCVSRYHVTEEEMYRIIALFRVCHLSAQHNETVDTEDLIRKPVVIENVIKLKDGYQYIDTFAIHSMPENATVSISMEDSPFEDDW